MSLLLRDNRVFTLALRDVQPPNALNAYQLNNVGTYFTEILDVGTFTEGILFLIAANSVGTNPTLDCKVQYSPDKINWIDSGDSFTQITSNGSALKKLTSNFGKYVRCLISIGGTATPGYKTTLYLAVKG